MFREIKHFLEQIIQEQPHLEPWLQWSPAMETQIMIDTDGLTEHKSERGVYWTDDAGKRYWHIRIPKSANSNPNYTDRPCNTMDRWKLFGTSGWSWMTRQSLWLGYDIDGLNHEKGHGEATVEELKNRLLELPYVLLRTSKSGKGLHAMVVVNPVTTRNRREHTQLAKHVLVNQLSRDTGLNLINYVDPNGIGLMLWHWGQEVSSDGLKHIT